MHDLFKVRIACTLPVRGARPIFFLLTHLVSFCPPDPSNPRPNMPTTKNPASIWMPCEISDGTKHWRKMKWRMRPKMGRRRKKKRTPSGPVTCANRNLRTKNSASFIWSQFFTLAAPQLLVYYMGLIAHLDSLALLPVSSLFLCSKQNAAA
jgi:hypothetical protein